MPDVVLKVGGHDYSGWKTVKVMRSLESISGSFEIGVVDWWTDGRAFPVRPGDACELQLFDEPVITGYIDELEVNDAPSQHTVKLTGRDAVADLVDCSAAHSSGEWRNRTLEQLATELCKPFFISVRAEVNTGDPVSKFSLQEGETVFTALARLARLRGLLLVADGNGLAITRSGTGSFDTELELGINLLSVTTRWSLSDRFSQYTCKGQRPCDDWTDPADAASQKVVVTDPAISRYRPLTLLPEGIGDLAALTRRAQWERNVRRGRGTSVTAKVQGWKAGAQLWKVNRRVRYRNTRQKLDVELLISGVEFSLDNQGMITELILTDPSAFEVEPVTETQGKGDTW